MSNEMSLLLIDDDSEFLNVSRIFLEESGFHNIATARSAREAQDLLASRSFDVIIADYELPPGMNSLQLLKALKAQGDETPFIIFTGKSREEVAIEALNCGAAYYLQKAVEIDVQYAELRNMIMQLAEKKRAKERVRWQELELRSKNEELESFCYSISHDLRAPLRIIDGYCGVIQTIGGNDLDPRILNYFNGIRSASLRMNIMIESLLKFSRAGRLGIECHDVDLSRMVWDITGALRENSPGREVSVHIQDGMTVSADKTLLSMAMQNLLDNAWKYTGRTENAEIAVRMTPNEAGESVVSVCDNGAGFDSASAENLFRPFSRFHTESEFPGTGIGLATVHRIIERHGGRIWAESQVGHGATFSFTLPGCIDQPAQGTPVCGDSPYCGDFCLKKK